mmetsp:Transcript_3375/g.7228  ORF Transcript_3375/g.7228 Transcript_3375/m.7228 type:complete len:81 (+) Transcript_3375:203-445(+)
MSVQVTKMARGITPGLHSAMTCAAWVGSDGSPGDSSYGHGSSHKQRDGGQWLAPPLPAPSGSFLCSLASCRWRDKSMTPF